MFILEFFKEFVKFWILSFKFKFFISIPNKFGFNMNDKICWSTIFLLFLFFESKLSIISKEKYFKFSQYIKILYNKGKLSSEIFIDNF